MDDKQTIPITLTGTIEVSRESLHSLLCSMIEALPNPTPSVTATRPPLNAVTESGLPRLAYSVHETAEALGVSDKTIHRLLQRGLLKSSGAISIHKRYCVQELYEQFQILVAFAMCRLRIEKALKDVAVERLSIIVVRNEIEQIEGNALISNSNVGLICFRQGTDLFEQR